MCQNVHKCGKELLVTNFNNKRCIQNLIEYIWLVNQEFNDLSHSEQLLLLPQYFQKLSAEGASKCVYMLETVKTYAYLKPGDKNCSLIIIGHEIKNL